MKSSRCWPHSLISTKSSMPDNVAQSTSSSISGNGYKTRQRWRGSDSAEKWSRTEADGRGCDMGGSESSKLPMNHIRSAAAAAHVNLERLPCREGACRLPALSYFDIM